MPPNRKRIDHGGGGGHGHLGVLTRPLKCCVPTECFQLGKLIYVEDIGTSDLEVVKIICNNDHCDEGGFMHKECFDVWEQSVITYLKSCGRARSWSDKQRLQNLWTKKGYDLAFKACNCKCGKGHIRKDLNWSQPERSAPIVIPQLQAPAHIEQMQQQMQDHSDIAVAQMQMQGLTIQSTNGEVKKKKKSKSREARPTLAISAPIPHPNNNHGRGNGDIFGCSSKTNGHSPPYGSNSSNGSAEMCASPTGISMISLSRNRINSVSSNGSNSSSSSGGSGSPPSPGAQFCSPPNISAANQLKFSRKNSKGNNDLMLERTRRDSGGLFSRRMDFSSFNQLPRHKLNSYQIKMEEESHGNDDTRNLVLNTLMNSKTFRVGCILCNVNLVIFDRFPLIDGTFFLSPRQHSKSSLEVLHSDGHTQYLSAVCMGCLEGWFTALYCRCCGCRWDGSSLVLGSCYSYDIFAAMPCCHERLACLNCKAYVVPPERRPLFFSDYSQSSYCPTCGTMDFHMAKPLPLIFNKMST